MTKERGGRLGRKIENVVTNVANCSAPLRMWLRAEIERTKSDLSARDSSTGLISRPGKGDISTSVIIGNGASGEKYADAIGPYLDDFGPSHFIVYPQSRFEPDAVGDRLLEVGQIDKGMPRTIICFSMGQMIMNHLYTKSDFAEEMTNVVCLTSDSGVAQIDNLKFGTKLLLSVGGSMNPSHTVSVFYDRAMNTRDGRLYEEISQWNWMLHADVLEPGQLKDVGHRIPYKYYISAPDDNRVNLERSYDDLNSYYGGGWQWLVSPRRRRISHTEGFEKPQDFTDLLGSVAVNALVDK